MCVTLTEQETNVTSEVQRWKTPAATRRNGYGSASTTIVSTTSATTVFYFTLFYYTFATTRLHRRYTETLKTQFILLCQTFKCPIFDQMGKASKSEKEKMMLWKSGRVLVEIAECRHHEHKVRRKQRQQTA